MAQVSAQNPLGSDEVENKNIDNTRTAIRLEEKAIPIIKQSKLAALGILELLLEVRHEVELVPKLLTDIIDCTLEYAESIDKIITKDSRIVITEKDSELYSYSFLRVKKLLLSDIANAEDRREAVQVYKMFVE